MWEEGWKIADQSDAYARVESPNRLLLCGMGGSSIGGALLESLSFESSGIPVGLCRRYVVPSWAQEDTLVVCTSYSGNTEETLSAYDDAGRRGARRFCITSGGELARRAEAEDVPFVTIPGGLPPRAALPYTFVPLLQLASRLGIVRVEDADMRRVASLLRDLGSEYGDNTPNEATVVADYLVGRIPIIYSGTGLLAAVNLRWRGQIQENAKCPAFGNVYPELNHNEIEGWESSSDVLGMFAVVELAEADDPAPVRRRMDVTRSLLEEKAAGWYRFEPQGDTPLDRMLSGVVLGDWVSYYLARLLEVDPMPVALIDALKAALSARSVG
jgi:glucose/mannose-6-phosphate isomerase